MGKGILKTYTSVFCSRVVESFGDLHWGKAPPTVLCIIIYFIPALLDKFVNTPLPRAVSYIVVRDVFIMRRVPRDAVVRFLFRFFPADRSKYLVRTTPQYRVFDFWSEVRNEGHSLFFHFTVESLEKFHGFFFHTTVSNNFSGVTVSPFYFLFLVWVREKGMYCNSTYDNDQW